MNEPTWSHVELLGSILALAVQPECHSKQQAKKVALEVVGLLTKEQRKQALVHFHGAVQDQDLRMGVCL